MATLGAQLTSAANAGAALNNPQDYMSEIGRAQQAYKQYGDAGRTDLQQGAHTYADTIRAAAAAKGVDLSSYGTDFTKNYSGANPLAYDPTKSGQVEYAPKSPVVDAAKTGGTFNALGKAGDGTGDNGGQGNGGGTGGGGGGGAPNNDSLIKSIYDSMYAAQSQKAKALRDQQLAGLAGQDTLAQNNAQSSLNANDVSGSRLANQLREHMANLGLLQGGDYISQQVGQNTAQGQNANQINMDLATKLQGLAAQKDAINNNASASDLALLQQIQAEQGKTQLSDAYHQQDYGLQKAGLLGKFDNGQLTANQSNADRTYGLAKSAQDYAENPNNPTNTGLGLNNQLTQLKLNDYPAQSKAAAQEVQQKLAAGEITNQEAQKKLDDLKDPNSLTNQKIKADIDLTKSQSEYYKDHGQYYAGGGSQSGSNSANKTAATNTYTGTVYDQLSQLDPSDYSGYLKANQGEIVSNIGQKAYDALEKSVLSDQNAQGKADTAQGKIDATIRSQAIAAAQKDSRWLDGKTDKKALIKEYESYHQ